MSVKEKYAHLRPLPPDITRRLQQVPMVLQRHPLRLAYLFGSAAREISESADIDLAVLPEAGFSYTTLYADLSQTLGTDRLDLVDLRFAPLFLQWEVVERGRPLVVQSEEERFHFERGVRMRYRDERQRWCRYIAVVQGGAAAMAVQRDFVVRALAELERVVQELEKYQGTTAQGMAANLSLRWTVERGLLAGLTLLFQVADHILTAHFRRTAETYEGLLLELYTCGVLSEGLYGQLRGAGGFRNVLVHEYISIDLNEVAHTLQKAPEVLRAFAEVLEPKELRAYVAEAVRQMMALYEGRRESNGSKR